EHEIVSAAQATIQGLIEQLRIVIGERDAARGERNALRAILTQHGLTTADEATEPEDVCGEQSSAR
ncbi:MAG: hypothetical protein KGL35_18445, partial [Bradyrhizobium sp.]|nr:hypothetical protein [Bradyrhizobium sp.]